MAKVLLIGLGNMGRKYLKKFEELGIKPSLCDINENLRGEFEDYPFFCSYGDLEDTPEKVFVAVNPQYHPEIAAHFLERGSYVFLEKPPALSGGELIPLVEKYGKDHLGVSEIERYSFAVRNLKINPERVLGIKINRLNAGKGYINPVWDLAWHDLYLLLYLFGDFKIKEVHKRGEHFYTLKGEVLNSIPFELNVAWNYPQVDRSWGIETPDGEIILDFYRERRIENGIITSERKSGDKLLEMVKDVLEDKYDPLSVERAIKLLSELERIKENL